MGENDEVILTRVRLQVDAHVTDAVRFFAELTDARLNEDEHHRSEWPGTRYKLGTGSPRPFSGLRGFETAAGALPEDRPPAATASTNRSRRCSKWELTASCRNPTVRSILFEKSGEFWIKSFDGWWPTVHVVAGFRQPVVIVNPSLRYFVIRHCRVSR